MLSSSLSSERNNRKKCLSLQLAPVLIQSGADCPWEGPRVCLHVKSLQSCLTLCNPVDCSPPGSSVHGILQARTLEWVATPSSRGSSQPRDQTRASYSSCIAGGFFTREPLGEAREGPYRNAIVCLRLFPQVHLHMRAPVQDWKNCALSNMRGTRFYIMGE